MDDARITGPSAAVPVTATVTAETAAAFTRDGVACAPAGPGRRIPGREGVQMFGACR